MAVDEKAAPLMDVIAKLVKLIAEQGYDATTADQLAEAAQMSRSTFFRRFGSKEDVVFADHDYLLHQIGIYLENHAGDPLETVSLAGGVVYRHHLEHQETALARYRLMHEDRNLRDRELIARHRYELIFVKYLKEKLPDTEFRKYGSVAFASALVSVHNAILVEWFKDPTVDRSEEFEAAAQRLIDIFRPLLLPGKSASSDGRVMVTFFEQNASSEAIVKAVKKALNGNDTRL